MVVLYNPGATNRAIIQPGTPGALPIDGRLFVQEPSDGHLLAGDRDRPYRLSRVTGADLRSARTSRRMAALLRLRIAQRDCPFPGAGRFGCRSHLVFVDEIDFRYGERAPNLNTPAWRGRTSRNQKRRAFPNYVPRPRRGQPGAELREAMKILASQPFPGGGTYADRVHFYLNPGVVSSLGVGRGRFHNLGRDRKPHYRSYEALRAALQRSGGVWLEMYHVFGSGRTRVPFNTREWMNYPARFALYLTAPGAPAPDPALTAKVRFVMTRGAPPLRSGAPAPCANPSQPQGCQFALAALPQNAPILANGVAAYRMEGDEAEWRAHARAWFFR